MAGDHCLNVLYPARPGQTIKGEHVHEGHTSSRIQQNSLAKVVLESKLKRPTNEYPKTSPTVESSSCPGRSPEAEGRVLVVIPANQCLPR